MRTVSPGSPPPLATAESNTQGCGRRSDRSLPSLRRIVFIGGILPAKECWDVTKRLRVWAAAIMLGMGAAQAWADTVLTLDVAQEPVLLGEAGQAWTDPTGRLSPEVVAVDHGVAWRPMREGAVYPLSHGTSLWNHFTVNAPGTERWYLQEPYPAVDKATLYSLDGNAGWGFSAGDTIDVEEWPVPHRYPLFPLSRGTQEYLVRVDNAHSFSAPLEFVSESHLLQDAQKASLILGLYFGLAGLAVALALLSAFSLCVRAFVLYAVSVAFLALTQASLTGISGLHLWPHWAWWNDVSALALPVLGVGSLQWFFSEVVSMPQRSRLLHYLLVATGLASVAIAAALMLVEPSLRFRLMVPYIAIAGTIGLASVLWAARRGARWAGWRQ